MLDLTRRSPFTLHREVDDIFNRFFGNAWRQSRPDQGDETPSWWPAVESYQQNGAFCIRLALPGVDPKDVDVSVTDRTLTVSGSRQAPEGSEGTYFQRELPYGRFERSFLIPDGVDVARVNARYANGMLEITMPAPGLPVPKKIEIQLDGKASERKQIAA
jgi:HSP20 family protein